MKTSFIFLLFSLISSSHASTVSITTCPSACYCDDSLVFINCVGDEIWELPPDIPNTVIRLELRNFIMGTLSEAQFKGLSNITELKLQQSQIKTIEDGTFAGLDKLVRLDLSQNSIENITRSTFTGLTTLRYLDLSSNQLVNVNRAFQDMLNIEQLNLRDNRLKQLTPDTFVGLQRVQYLNLDSNYIDTIDVETFKFLFHLVHLIISNNPISNLTRLDFLSARLLYIDISHVGLLRAPESLTKIVRDLRLAKNNLTQIRCGDFDNYPELGLLVLDDNQITEVEDFALGTQKLLLRLWLNGNRLSKIPANLPTNLKTLYIEENQLESLPPYAFQGLSNVEQLFLQRNKIKKISVCAFCDLTSLRSLDLQSNLIENLEEGVFANMSQLDSLDVSVNPLLALQASCFVGADSLHILRMSRIKTLPRFDDDVFDNLKKLEILELYDSAGFAQLVLNSTRVLQSLSSVRELNVMHNNIRSLRQDFLQFFTGLREIKLSGNIWHCDQSILWMAQWIKKAEILFYRSYSIRCATPIELQNKPVMTLTEADFPTTTTVTTSTATTTTTNAPTTIRTTTNALTTTRPTTTTSEPTTTTNKPTTTTSEPTTAPITASTTVLPKITTSTTRKTVFFTPKTRKPYRKETPIPTSTPTSTMKTTTTPTLTMKTTTTRLTTTKKLITSLPTTATTKELITILPTITTTFKSYKKLSKAHKPESTVSGVSVDDNQDDQFVIVAIALISGILLVILVSTIALLIYRCYQNGSTIGCRSYPTIKKNGSISYSPQRDEVSIVTVSEGTFGLKTSTHHGLGNKLYYVMDNGNESSPESDLNELLPPPEDNGYYPYSETY